VNPLGDTGEVAKNTTLEAVGVGAMASAGVLASQARYFEALAMVAIGVTCFVMKYARRRWDF